jgi:aspartate racemase
MRTVGILGGMGPEATVLLMQKVIRGVPASDDADHVHLIVDQNPQVPSRIAFFLEGKGENPGPVLARMAKGLEDAGAEALGMACNTAHHYAPEIRAAVSVPFLDMVELSAEAASDAAKPGATVGVLASPAVRLTGLYDRALNAVGARAEYPKDQDSLLAAIREIKKNGDTPVARERLSAASVDLMDRGVAVQLIACTEFSVIADAVAPGAVAMDTLDVLADAIVRFARGPAN